jgi:hypothetical protein
LCVLYRALNYLPVQTDKCTLVKLFSYTRLLLLAPTCFGHSCDHLQGVPQYKYQQYNRNHIKFSKILLFIKASFSLQTDLTGYSLPNASQNNTVIVHNILPSLNESFSRCCFRMDRILENFIKNFIWFL